MFAQDCWPGNHSKCVTNLRLTSDTGEILTYRPSRLKSGLQAPAVLFYPCNKCRVPHIPKFPVEFRGFSTLHAALLNESRTRGPLQSCLKEIWGISLVFREMWDTTDLDLELLSSHADDLGPEGYGL